MNLRSAMTRSARRRASRSPTRRSPAPTSSRTARWWCWRIRLRGGQVGRLPHHHRAGLRQLRRDRSDLLGAHLLPRPGRRGCCGARLRAAVKAMEEAGLAAICSYIFHSREQLGCLRVNDGVLFLEKMYFANEILDAAAAKPKGQRINAGELKAARQLIDTMAGTVRPEKYEDSYREALLRVIRKKAKGEKITVPEPDQPAETPDLMAALEESLKATSKPRRRRRSTRKKARARS